MRLLFAVIAAIVFAPLNLASAQSETEPYPISGTVGLWAEPSQPGEYLDPFDPLLREKVGTLLIFLVVETSAPLTTAQFDRFQGEVASAAGMTDETRVSSAPHLLTESVGFLQVNGRGSSYLIIAYEESLVFIIASTSSSRDSGHESDLDQIARNYLTSYRQSSAPPMTQALAEGFIGSDDFTVERPLGLLPSQTDLPAGFQLIDKDFIEITVKSLQVSELDPLNLMQSHQAFVR